MEQQSALARLMATENIRVEHQKLATAAFDVANRTLYLPIWKNMSPELYDLLRAHEIGHALWTPTDGWHGTVYKNQELRSFLNVVEDARIERKIKTRFPGTRPSFVKGYKELFDRDFFGTQGRDLRKALLVDRINLHFKVGSFLNIQFSDSEKVLVQRINDAETWDDVVALAMEIYDLDKEEFQKQIQEQRNDSDSSGQGKQGQETEPGQSGQGMEADEQNQGQGESNANGSGDDDTTDQAGQPDRTGTSGHGITNNITDESYKRQTRLDWLKPSPTPESHTDKHFRSMEESLVDRKAAPWVYYDWPKQIQLKDIIVPYSQVAYEFDHTDPHVVRSLRHDRSAEPGLRILEENKLVCNYKEYMAHFHATNKGFVDHMAREFEIKRNARQLARASQSKTGALNLKKVHQYKLTDDLFQRLTVVPKGKSHGMVVLFDQSGSMSNHYSSTIEQIVILSMFCRKVGIPFEVYGFSDNTEHLSCHLPKINEFYGSESEIQARSRAYAHPGFSRNVGEIALQGSAFRLRQYLSSTMKGSEYKRMVERLLYLSVCFGSGFDTTKAKLKYRGDNNKIYYIPQSERLQSTPLNHAVISMSALVPAFREANQLDIVNVIYLTDGDSNHTFQRWADYPDPKDRSVIVRSVKDPRDMAIRMSQTKDHVTVTVRDPSSGIEVHRKQGAGIKDGQSMTDALLEMVAKKTGARNIGYFISGGGAMWNLREHMMSVASAQKSAGTENFKGADLVQVHEGFPAAKAELKAQGFYKRPTKGYRKHFFVPSKNLDIHDAALQGTDARTLRKEFRDQGLDKRKQRLLMANFIEEIA